MSVTGVYLVIKTHLNKGYLLKPPEQAYIHDVTTNMRKYNILPIFQRGQKILNKTHGMSFKFCDENVKHQGRL